MKRIILASSSAYRKELLNKTGLDFECLSPNVDESGLTRQLLKTGATPEHVAAQLSRAKALAVRSTQSDMDALIISGDQFVSFQGKIIGKPHQHTTALQQLQELNGQLHTLITCVTLMEADKTTDYTHTTRLQMKNLTLAEIQGYLESEKPYDCAGSYKIESKGIALFSHIDCDDFTAIQGIPMIWLTNQLKERGYEFFRK